MTRLRATPGSVLTIALAALLGLLIGRYAVPAQQSAGQTLFDRQHDFSYVNPLLACADPSGTLPGEVVRTRVALEAYLDTARSQGRIAEAGIFFRDLNNGPWFGIGDETTFSPGSLLKVPLMMTVLRAAERDRSIMAREIEFAGGDAGVPQEIGASDPVVPGRTYTVEALLRAMITQSDNNAALLLYRSLDPDLLAEVYRDLGLDVPDPGRDYEISVRGYATFFRLLYNATYLTAEDSEYALRLLADAAFREGIVAGVPQTAPVAHKFGERGGAGIQQLHDCGIVYADNSPYVLCVMTRGGSVEGLQRVIADVSRIVYEGLGA